MGKSFNDPALVCVHFVWEHVTCLECEIADSTVDDAGVGPMAECMGTTRIVKGT